VTRRAAECTLGADLGIETASRWRSSGAASLCAWSSLPRATVCLRHTCMTAGADPGYRGPGVQETRESSWPRYSKRGSLSNAASPVRNGAGGLVEVMAPNELCLELRGVVGFRALASSLIEENQDAVRSRILPRRLRVQSRLAHAPEARVRTDTRTQELVSANADDMTGGPVGVPARLAVAPPGPAPLRRLRPTTWSLPDGMTQHWLRQISLSVSSSAPLVPDANRFTPRAIP
jgi:hypothetical protein